MPDANGPLAGIRVLELGGIGPVPFCGMMLADMGADVVRIDRSGRPGHPILNRGRRSLIVDLKHPRGVDVVRRLARSVDATLEGFRPGVTEGLGIGPEDLLAVNPSLVYGRMTGWGQDGPLARVPGHDINYLSLSGALHAIGPAGGDPVVPLNLVADFGGGGMLLAYGVICGILRSRASGLGQMVDAAMLDGVGALLAMAHGFLNEGRWTDERGVNRLDGGAPWYRVYRCADGRHMAVGCVEAPFYAAFLDVLGLADDPDFAYQNATSRWPTMHRRLEELFLSKTRDEWCALFKNTQACTTPVLSLREAVNHPHNAARGTHQRDRDGAIQPMPAPRFAGTPAKLPHPAPAPGSNTREVLAEAGFTEFEIEDLHGAGAVVSARAGTEEG